MDEPDGATIERAMEQCLLQRHGRRPTQDQIRDGFEAAMGLVNGYVPTFGELIALGIEEHLAFDGGRKQQARGLLDRFCCRRVGWDSVRRTGQEGGAGGPSFGFTVHPAYAQRVWDRARAIDGPWRRCNYIPTTTRTYLQPIFNETSAANGQQFGGLTAFMGQGEIFPTTTTDGRLGMIELTCERLMIACNISRDLLRDTTQRIAAELEYMSITTMRRAVESMMVLGNIRGSGVAYQDPGCLQGVITAPSTVTVAKASGDPSHGISKADLDAAAGAIAAPNQMSPNYCVHMSAATKAAIWQLASNGGWDIIQTLPDGQGGRVEYLHGARVIPNEFCPNLGTPGDVIFADWNDYSLCYVQVNPLASPLGFAIRQPADAGHLGVVGMPANAVESRMSEHMYFTQDLASFLWKCRLSGHWRWSGTAVDAQGNTVGPASIVAAR